MLFANSQDESQPTQVPDLPQDGSGNAIMKQLFGKKVGATKRRIDRRKEGRKNTGKSQKILKSINKDKVCLIDR